MIIHTQVGAERCALRRYLVVISTRTIATVSDRRAFDLAVGVAFDPGTRLAHIVIDVIGLICAPKRL